MMQKVKAKCKQTKKNMLGITQLQNARLVAKVKGVKEKNLKFEFLFCSYLSFYTSTL